MARQLDRVAWNEGEHRPETCLTNAYLTLVLSKGSQAGISVRYAESLFAGFTPGGARKGNRDEVEGKVFYRLVGGKWDMNISLPAGTLGRLIWKGKEYLLKEGENKVVV